MAVIPFQKPDKVVMLEADESHGKFEFRPLEPGYGITIGNALRRILLSSLEGFAITSLKIDSVDHEFSTIKGVIEDVTEIILQLKQVRFKQQIEDFDGEKVTVTISGKDVYKAGDIGKFLTGFKILNPELEICHMEPDVTLKIDLNISKGRGYVSPEENVPEEEKSVSFLSDLFLHPFETCSTALTMCVWNKKPTTKSCCLKSILMALFILKTRSKRLLKS